MTTTMLMSSMTARRLVCEFVFPFRDSESPATRSRLFVRPEPTVVPLATAFPFAALSYYCYYSIDSSIQFPTPFLTRIIVIDPGFLIFPGFVVCVSRIVHGFGLARGRRQYTKDRVCNRLSRHGGAPIFAQQTQTNIAVAVDVFVDRNMRW